MRRREFIAGLSAVASYAPWPLTAHAQQSSKVYRIAWIAPAAQRRADMNESSNPGIRAFFEELRRLGYVEGRNLILERYPGEGRTEHYGELANEVVRRKPDLIFTINAIALHLKSATIPIVVITGDPVAWGFATSLAHPGGYMTGVSTDAGFDVWGKRLQLLKETIPGLSSVGFLAPRRLFAPEFAASLAARGLLRGGVREAAQQLGISYFIFPLDGTLDEAEYRRAFAAMSLDRLDAIIVDTAGENFANRGVVVELAEKARLPVMYPWREAVEVGGLMAYSFDAPELNRHMAQQVDQIFRGAKPQDIPFYQPTKFELIVNAKTARALGLTFPPSLVADEVIE
jgi:putative tryptophan/tyrosine transport system substrate-binding protein